MNAIHSARLTRIAVIIAALVLACAGARGAPALDRVVHAVIDPALSGAHGDQSVIVQTTGTARTAASHVQGDGGTITRWLPIVGGFAARMDARRVEQLARVAGVRAITLDRRIHTLAGGSTSGPASVYPTIDGATTMWSKGYTGKGVTVALIDTGIASVGDLSGRIVSVTQDNGTTATCINFSGESGCGDSYGHGTFVAGIIAGSGAASKGKYKGVAPDAKLLSVKLAGRDGSADVSALLAALQWVTENRTQYGIKVVNLSLGTDSIQSYRIDPLNYAVEQVWNAGIVVVVAASNRGPSSFTITKPGDDPLVITVGAIDDLGTTGTSDDVLPNFTARGPTQTDLLTKPDLVAPGAHIISLRAPGSAVDQNFPTYIDATYRRGSGTSFSTPQVTGSVALLLQKDPTLAPNRIKYMLMSKARATMTSDPNKVGAGVVQAYDATTAGAGTANQGLVLSTGLGTLDLSRGTVSVQTTDLLPVVISGLTTQQLRIFDPLRFATNWAGASWHDSQWFGASWHGASWHTSNWTGASWHGASWHSTDDQPNTSYGLGWIADKIYGAWE